MNRHRKRYRRLVWILAAAALAPVGCGAAKERAPARPVTLKLWLPCVLGGPIRKAAAAYEAKHPGVELAPETYKPLQPLPRAEGPAVVITAGDTEMETLVRAGLVARDQVRTFAANTYPLAVVAPAEGAPGLKQLADLAGASAKRIFLEDPSRSSLGAAAARGFQSLGLWERIRPKTISPRPGVMVLAELLAGKAEAAVVFRDCLFAEAGPGAEPPKTIRVVGELPLDLYPPIPYQAAAMNDRGQARPARQFVDFLMGEEGQEELRKAGLRPVGNR